MFQYFIKLFQAWISKQTMGGMPGAELSMGSLDVNYEDAKDFELSTVPHRDKWILWLPLFISPVAEQESQTLVWRTFLRVSSSGLCSSLFLAIEGKPCSVRANKWNLHHKKPPNIYSTSHYWQCVYNTVPGRASKFSLLTASAGCPARASEKIMRKLASLSYLTYFWPRKTSERWLNHPNISRHSNQIKHIWIWAAIIK